MSALKNQWREWNETLQGQKLYTGTLLFVMLIAAMLEGFGFSLILPLLNSSIGAENSNDLISRMVSAVVRSLPWGSEVVRICIVLMFAFVVKNLLVVLHKWMAGHFVWKLREVWSDQIFRRYLHGSYGTVLAQKQGNLVNNANVEPQIAAKSMRALVELMSRFFLSFCLYWVLLLAHWQVTLVLTGLGFALVFFGKKRTDRVLSSIGRLRIQLNQTLSAIATEGIGAIRQIKTFGIEDQFAGRFLEKLKSFTRNETLYNILTQLPLNIGEVFIVLCFCSLLIYVDVFTSIPLKSVIPLLGLFIVVARKMFSDFSLIVSLWMQFLSCSPSLKLVHRLVHTPVEQEVLGAGKTFSGLNKGIVFEAVRFGYVSQKTVFDRLDLELPKGKMVAIVGPSGIGKSTIADLLLGMYRPNAGKILIDGEDLRDFSLLSWRARLGYVSQDPYLLHATIRENILCGKPGASQEAIVAAARLSRAHEFIQELTDQYETVVGDRGLKLSGGQRQRIAIARVILRDPDLYIFDEATSALDSESEKLIQQAIEDLAKSKTVLMIAHRLSTIQNVDRIYRIRPDKTLEEVCYADLTRAEENTGYLALENKGA